MSASSRLSIAICCAFLSTIQFARAQGGAATATTPTPAAAAAQATSSAASLTVVVLKAMSTQTSTITSAQVTSVIAVATNASNCAKSTLDFVSSDLLAKAQAAAAQTQVTADAVSSITKALAISPQEATAAVLAALGSATSAEKAAQDALKAIAPPATTAPATSTPAAATPATTTSAGSTPPVSAAVAAPDLAMIAVIERLFDTARAATNSTGNSIEVRLASIDAMGNIGTRAENNLGKLAALLPIPGIDVAVQSDEERVEIATHVVAAIAKLGTQAQPLISQIQQTRSINPSLNKAVDDAMTKILPAAK